MITLQRDQLLAKWPEQSPSATAHATELQGPRGKGGRPFKYDWEGALIFCIVHIYEHELHKIQQNLVDRISEWFIATQGSSRDDKLIKRRVSKIHRAFRDAKITPYSD